VTDAGFDLEAAIAREAARHAVTLAPGGVASLAAHARAVWRANDELHLTSIDEPDEFVRRHVGEAFEGAALVEPDASGLLVDLGSGNGYPGIPLALARPGLGLLLAEASTKRASFLRSALATAGIERAAVLERQIQRAADLADVEPIRVLASRAMGGWAKILPRLVPALSPDGVILLWAGEDVETVSRREIWRRLRVTARHPLPGRDQSWIWRLEPAPSSPSPSSSPLPG
jgi:16S rRNA (guanine527-N7)-methyltransferase